MMNADYDGDERQFCIQNEQLQHTYWNSDCRSNNIIAQCQARLRLGPNRTVTYKAAINDMRNIFFGLESPRACITLLHICYAFMWKWGHNRLLCKECAKYRPHVVGHTWHRTFCQSRETCVNVMCVTCGSIQFSKVLIFENVFQECADPFKTLDMSHQATQADCCATYLGRTPESPHKFLWEKRGLVRQTRVR